MRDVFDTLFELQRAYLDCVRQGLQAEDAHPRQGPILALLLAMDGASQAELVRKLNVSAATVAVSVARLERLGLVRREKNQHNQRANALALTPHGREQAERLRAAMQRACGLALKDVPPEELIRMELLMRDMCDHLREAARNLAVTDVSETDNQDP